MKIDEVAAGSISECSAVRKGGLWGLCTGPQRERFHRRAVVAGSLSSCLPNALADQDALLLGFRGPLAPRS